MLIALTNSPWALADGVLVRDCAGIGPHKRDAAFQQTYAQFRCRVVADADGAPRGEILVEPTGPEAMRIVRALSGNPPPARPIGAIPRGRGRIVGHDAQSDQRRHDARHSRGHERDRRQPTRSRRRRSASRS